MHIYILKCHKKVTSGCFENSVPENEEFNNGLRYFSRFRIFSVGLVISLSKIEQPKRVHRVRLKEHQNYIRIKEYRKFTIDKDRIFGSPHASLIIQMLKSFKDIIQFWI